MHIMATTYAHSIHTHTHTHTHTSANTVPRLYRYELMVYNISYQNDGDIPYFSPHFL